MIDQDKIRTAMRLIIEAIGEDPEREGLRDTPDRVARMYSEIFNGRRNWKSSTCHRAFK